MPDTTISYPVCLSGPLAFSNLPVDDHRLGGTALPKSMLELLPLTSRSGALPGTRTWIVRVLSLDTVELPAKTDANIPCLIYAQQATLYHLRCSSHAASTSVVPIRRQSSRWVPALSTMYNDLRSHVHRVMQDSIGTFY